MAADEIEVRPATEDDRRSLALLSVFPHNDAAIALYRKFGFVQEGRLVRHVRRADGQFWDLIEMGLLLGTDRSTSSCHVT
jgi:ribosomal protein S18 acetylase RimI-like enzyme